MNLKRNLKMQIQNFKMKRRYLKYCAFASVVLFIYYYLGVSDYINSEEIEKGFDYPLNVDVKALVNQIMLGNKVDVAPINYYPYRFLTNSGKCATLDKLDLFIAVKSAMDHFGHRDAIRKTIGQENIPGVTFRLLFFLGIDGTRNSDLQKKINKEMAEFNDIIQIDFIDNYYNNTIKTMMSFRWVYTHCSAADYYLFTDDDMYISVKNLLQYVRGREPGVKEKSNDSKIPEDYEYTTVDDRKNELFAGYVFKSSPQRFKSSKWSVSLSEYRWNRWPAYVTAGAYVVSNYSMKVMYIASLFVKHFRFDDIYLGIVAKKVGITPVHCEQFYFYKKTYSKDGYRDVIASHGYGNHEELISVWNEQNGIV